MWEHIVSALSLLLVWQNLLWVVCGILAGMLIGFLPGMAGSVALALLIPVSFALDPAVAVLFLIGAYAPAGFGGMLTSILMNTPGDPENAATTLDGYPMAQQGRAKAAIGAALTASVLGGLVGTVVLLSLIPVAEIAVLSFSYPEFFMLAIAGLCIIAITMEGSTVKGLVAAGLGLMVAFIGLDPVAGNPRFTFDFLYLWDGINIIPVIIGIFAGSEVLALYGRGVSVEQSSPQSGKALETDRGRPVPVTFVDGIFATFRRWWLVIRSSLIGTVVGAIPGVGGAVSGFLAYSHAKQSSKHPEEFGRGTVDGVIASEAANDAKLGGSMLPTVAFGIPGAVGMAVLLGALIMHGLPVGPALLLEHVDIIYVLIIGMTFAKFVAPLIVWAVASQSTRLTRLRPGLFTPLVAVAALLGTYTMQMNHLDVLMALFFCYIGYAMRRYGFSRIAFIIAFVLGELVERTYHQTSTTFGSIWAVAERPISGFLLALAVFVLGYAVFSAWRDRRRGRSGAADDGEALDDAQGFQPGRLVFAVLCLAFTVVLIAEAWQISGAAADFPLTIGVPLAVALAVLVVVALVPLFRRRKAEEGPVDAETEETPERGRPVGGDVPAASVSEESGSGGEEAAQQPGSVAVAWTAYSSRDLSERTVLKRQLLFGTWALAFVLLAMATSYVIAMPVALFAFLRLMAKEGWRLSLIVAVVATTLFWALFDLALGVPLT